LSRTASAIALTLLVIASLVAVPQLEAQSEPPSFYRVKSLAAHLDFAVWVAVLASLIAGFIAGLFVGKYLAQSALPTNVMAVESYIVDVSAAAYTACEKSLEITRLAQSVVPAIYSWAAFLVYNDVDSQVTGSTSDAQLQQIVQNAVAEIIQPQQRALSSLILNASIAPALFATLYAAAWQYQMQRWQKVVYGSRSFYWYWENSSIHHPVLVVASSGSVVNVFTTLCGSSTAECTMTATLLLNGYPAARMRVVVGSGTFSMELASVDWNTIVTAMTSSTAPTVDISLSGSGVTVNDPVIEMINPSTGAVTMRLDPVDEAQRALSAAYRIIHTIYRSALAYAYIYRNLLRNGVELPIPVPVVFTDPVASRIERMSTKQLMALYAATLYALSKVDWSRVASVSQQAILASGAAVPYEFRGCIGFGGKQFCGSFEVIEIGAPVVVLYSGNQTLDTWMLLLYESSSGYSIVLAPPGAWVYNQGSAVTIERTTIAYAFNLSVPGPSQSPTPPPKPSNEKFELGLLLIGAILGGSLVLILRGGRRGEVAGARSY